MRSSRNGSTLVTVTVLMLILGIMVLLFLSYQTESVREFKNRNAHLQALADTRSMVFEALAKLPDMNTGDTETPLFADSSSKTEKAVLDINPFTVTIRAEKRSSGVLLAASAETGCTFTPKDTTVIICSPSTVEAPNISGTKIITENDSARQALPLNTKGCAQAKKRITELAAKTFEVSAEPTAVTEAADFDALPDTILGSLFIHSPSGLLKLDGKKKPIVITGDLQFTGKAQCRNLSAKVIGEVRVNDQTELTNCEIVTARRFFLADESRFSGRIAALEQVEIFGAAEVLKESLVISFAEKKGDSLTLSGAVSVREQARVSGSVITLGKDGIVTETDTKTTGILWSKTWISHSGTHRGTVRGASFRSDISAPQTPGQPTVQQITGRIEPPFARIPYPLPWYIGKPELISWQEWNE